MKLIHLIPKSSILSRFENLRIFHQQNTHCRNHRRDAFFDLRYHGSFSPSIFKVGINDIMKASYFQVFATRHKKQCTRWIKRTRFILAICEKYQLWT